MLFRSLVILACAAGLGLGVKGGDGAVLLGAEAFSARYASWATAGSLGAKVGAFVDGAANFLKAMGIPAGVIGSLRPNSWTDNSLLLVALAGASIPSFWLGLMLMVVFAGELQWLPSSGFTSVIHTGNIANLKNLILPAVALGFVNAALVARTARSSMLDVLNADYITTARSKGLAERVVIIKHALRNAAIPVTTVISFTFASLVSGAVVTESVFALPGIGSLIVSSVLKRDYPVIQGIMIIVAILYVGLNFITDLTYAFLDPRIRYS